VSDVTAEAEAILSLAGSWKMKEVRVVEDMEEGLVEAED
jgi:hypothetical protein